MIDSKLVRHRVYLLCAEWCGVCRAFEIPFKEALQAFNSVQAQWVDIEDSPEWEDRVDIESFPTLHVENSDGRVLFSGSIEPDADQLLRLLARL
ncbi:MAG TPA: thioredoxin family protein [Limnobacter sp.]|nr:thioredoxin family protein [Limnobacter sp.]